MSRLSRYSVLFVAERIPEITWSTPPSEWDPDNQILPKYQELRRFIQKLRADNTLRHKGVYTTGYPVTLEELYELQEYFAHIGSAIDERLDYGGLLSDGVVWAMEEFRRALIGLSSYVADMADALYDDMRSSPNYAYDME